MRKAVYTAVVVALVLSTGSASAQPSPKERKAEELIAVLHLEQENDRQLKAQEASFQALSDQQLASADPDPEQKKNFEAFRAQVFALLRKAARWDALKPEYVRLYSSTYTEQEIDGMLAFYTSSVGQAVTAKAAGLSQNAAAILQSHLDAVKPTIQKLMEETMLKLQ